MMQSDIVAQRFGGVGHEQVASLSPNVDDGALSAGGPMPIDIDLNNRPQTAGN